MDHLGPPDIVRQAYRALLASAESGELFACATPTTRNCSSDIGEAVPKWEVQQAVSGRLQGQPDFPMLLEALAAASSGNAAALIASSPPTIDQFWGFVEICNDYPIVNKSFEEYRRVLQAAASVDENHINQSQWILAQLICSAFPYAVPADEPLELNATMLLVTADFDCSAGTDMTTFVYSMQTTHSGLVVRHGEDHVSFNLPCAASTQITKEFLRTGVLPPREDDALVTVYGPGDQRWPVSDPYRVPTGFEAGDVDSA